MYIITSEHLDNVREWVTFAADISILFITIYTFYLTLISKKIKFQSISVSSSISEGGSFSVILENKALSPVVIEEVCLIIDNRYKVQVKKFDSPLILEPFKTQKIISDRYSYTEPSLPSISGNNTALEVKTFRKKLYLRLHKKTPKITRNIKQMPSNVTKVKNTYNGKIIPEFAKFVLTVSKEDWKNTVFIFNTGVMTGEILGFNGIPEEVVKEHVALTEFLDSWLKPNEVSYHVEKISNLF